MISVKIDNVDRTSIINFGSLTKRDVINQTADTGSFVINYDSVQTFRPEANSVIEIYDGVNKTFAGRICKVSKQVLGPGDVKYNCSFKDYSYDFGRILINEGYDNETVGDIIDDIAATVATEAGITFTTANVDCDILITKVRFARVPADECLDRLAKLTGFSFYIDYDKDIHFFERNSELAPFNLVDNDGNYVTDSLQVSDDFTQIRNRIFIKGAEIEGESRAETYVGSADNSRKFFKLSNKFARVPTVTVGGVSKTVGVDYLDNEADFDCFWDYNQQYIRFKTATTPGAVNVVITGIPLYTPEFQIEEPQSISDYGVFEFAETNKSILSRAQAADYADAQLTAYKNGIIEGSFETYTTGLRSGQIINITSTLLNVNEDFLVQEVAFKMVTPETYIYQVRLATLRTIGIVEFLIGLIRSEQRILESDSEVIIEKYVRPKENIDVSETISINTDDYPQQENVTAHENFYPQALNFDVRFVAGPYQHNPANSSDNLRVFIADGSRVG